MSSPARCPVPPPDPPVVVLDTNAVLDWLVYRHASCAGWADGFSEGRACWIASAAMRDELAHVLARGVVDAWRPQHDAVWAAWDRHARVVDPVPTAGAATRLRCTDPDDQKFVDLALAERARWLISRDRAVLKLARRTRPLGLEVLTPEAWAASFLSG